MAAHNDILRVGECIGTTYMAALSAHFEFSLPQRMSSHEFGSIEPVLGLAACRNVSAFAFFGNLLGKSLGGFVLSHHVGIDIYRPLAHAARIISIDTMFNSFGGLMAVTCQVVIVSLVLERVCHKVASLP